MPYLIHYTPEAQRDMDKIWDDVADVSQSFDTADDNINGLINVIGLKKQFPKSGIPLIYRNLFTGFYSVNYKAYKAFYHIQGKIIQAERVLPIKMDYLKILFGECE